MQPLTRVVLPHPDSPAMPRISPSLSENETPSTACILAAEPGEVVHAQIFDLEDGFHRAHFRRRGIEDPFHRRIEDIERRTR